jgi:hypothetical protein
MMRGEIQVQLFAQREPRDKGKRPVKFCAHIGARITRNFSVRNFRSLQSMVTMSRVLIVAGIFRRIDASPGEM